MTKRQVKKRKKRSLFSPEKFASPRKGKGASPAKQCAWCFFAVFFLVLSLGAFTGCSDSQKGNEADGLKIVATGFAEYDWVREILGDEFSQAQVTYLLADGVDLHSFEPTVADMVSILDCDVFFYAGNGSDAWIANVLAQKSEDTVAVNLLDLCSDSLRQEEITEGMTVREKDSGAETDEHVWLSLNCAMEICDKMADILGSIDTAHAQEYRDNADAYSKKLSALEKNYAEVCKGADNDTLIFADRFAFRYLFDDYGISSYAAFAGCDAESAASAQTVIFLAQKMDEIGSSTLITLENSDQKLAQTIFKNTAAKEGEILTLNSMQSVTGKEAESTTYLSLAKDNLTVLEKALYATDRRH